MRWEGMLQYHQRVTNMRATGMSYHQGGDIGILVFQ